MPPQSMNYISNCFVVLAAAFDSRSNSHWPWLLHWPAESIELKFWWGSSVEAKRVVCQMILDSIIWDTPETWKRIWCHSKAGPLHNLAYQANSGFWSQALAYTCQACYHAIKYPRAIAKENTYVGCIKKYIWYFALWRFISVYGLGCDNFKCV